VWVAESDDLPGLVTEADDVEQLLAKLKVMIPDLLHELDGDLDVLEIPFSVMLQKLHAKRGPNT
jgi:predicted RNase H-like HicB family nuclease